MICSFSLVFSNMKTGGQTSPTAFSFLVRTVLWWSGMRMASGMMSRVIITLLSAARRAQVIILLARVLSGALLLSLCITSDCRCFCSGLQPAPSSGKCTHIWQEAWTVRGQLSHQVPVPEGLHSKAPPDYPLSRQWTLGCAKNLLHDS